MTRAESDGVIDRREFQDLYTQILKHFGYGILTEPIDYDKMTQSETTDPKGNHMEKLAILNTTPPNGYQFSLKRNDKTLQVCLDPEGDGFKLKRDVPELDVEQINAAAEELRKELWKARVNAALEDGPVPLVRS